MLYPRLPGPLATAQLPPGSDPSKWLAQCPNKPDSYLTVSLPIRGEPASLRKFRHREFVELPGELWTAIVDSDTA